MKTIDMLTELTALLSESGHEEAVADYIESWIAKYTAHKVTRQGNNILVYLLGTDRRKCLIFNGHIDTVKVGDLQNWHTDPLKLTEKSDTLYGLGTSDMKGADAAMMELLLQYEAEKPACDLYVMFVAEEETTGSGTRDTLQLLAPKLAAYDQVAAIVGEATRLQAVLGHRGNAFVKVHFRGQGGHASRPPEATEQSVRKATAFIDSIGRQCQVWSGIYTDTLLGGVGVVVTALEAGTGAMNQIPTETTVTLDVRTIPAFHAKLQDEIEAWVKTFDGAAEILYPCPAGLCSPDEKIAQVVMKLAGQQDGQVTQGATDQQFFTEAGIPAVICGPGDKTVIHAPNEYIEKALLEACTERYMNIVTAWAA